jgi:hypothetical protein
LQENQPNSSDPAAPVDPGETPPHKPLAPQPIVARGGSYYRNTRYIMAALTVVMGFWFGYDGFVRWPAENKKIAELQAELPNLDATNPAQAAEVRTALKDHSPHSDTDVLLQRVLAFSLPPLGILLLIWALYNSRGEYRLADDTLHIPGHPPVPLTSVRELDESVWDRKGIARVSYTLADARAGTAKLDDFVYDRTPTDQIFDQIKSHLLPPAPIVANADPEGAPVSPDTSA